MNNPLISIIVPVYKVERYLPRCIESILRQTYANFELILVDDGTPDRSGIICDRYAEKDSRIRVIHKENGGVSTARNAGIDDAKGEWITFVDSDDWVSDDYLEVLLKPLEKYDCDLTVGTLEHRHIFISSPDRSECFIDIKETNSQEILNAINRTEFYGPFLKLFKSEIIKKRKLYFAVGMAVAEDALFVNCYLQHCEKIFLTGRVIYFYNELNALSVTNRLPYFENMHEWSLKYIQSYEDVLESFAISNPCKMQQVQKKAFYGFTSVARAVVSNFDEAEAKEKLSSLYIWYKDLLGDITFTEILDVDKHRQLAEQIRNENVDFIYNYLKPSKKRSMFVRTKKMVKKYVIRFLERYRDGVIKFNTRK